MKVLVTGAAGFIGFHVVKSLLSNGNMVVGVDNINDYYSVKLKYARLSELGIKPNDITENEHVVSSTYNTSFRFMKADISNREVLPKLFEAENFDVVINLAAQAGVRYSIENPFAYIESNIVGFTNILECCRYYPVKHLVYASSSSVYGGNTKVPFAETDMVDNPVSLYAATKKSNELMASCYSKLYNIPATGLRFFTVYGPWGRPDMAPMIFANTISRNQPIKVFNNGNMLRDFTYIDDIVEGVVRVANSAPEAQADGRRHTVYNIGCSTPVKLMDFISLLEKALGKKAEKVMLPMQQGDVYQTYADTLALENNIGYKPKVKLEQGIVEFAQWFNYYEKEIGE